MSSVLPKDQTVNTYDKRSSYYETKWEAYLYHTHEEFVRNIEMAQTDRILDISGGTGLLAQMLIQKSYPFEHLVINDPSEGMLDIAQQRLSGEAKISFSNCRAEETNYEANYFDRIFCLNSFHFYTRQQHVVDQCYHMLNPGGRLYVLDWNCTGLFHITNALITWLTSEHIDTRSLAELDSMLQKSGFKINKMDHWNWRYWKFFFVEVEKPA